MNIVGIAVILAQLTSGYQYNVWMPINSTSPMPSDAVLKQAGVKVGDWIITDANGTRWMVQQPVPCSPRVTTDPKDDCFFVIDRPTWNGRGICSRRMQ